MFRRKWSTTRSLPTIAFVIALFMAGFILLSFWMKIHPDVPTENHALVHKVADQNEQISLLQDKLKRAELEASELKTHADAKEQQEKPAKAEAKALSSDAVCTWTFHPGTTLGSTPNVGWDHCATEGDRCSCTGSVRYGRTTKWSERQSDGSILCSTNTFESDPSPGYLKECQCKGNSVGETTLEQAEKDCEAKGPLCKGVTCKGGNKEKCSIRDGVPYLGPEKSSDSWTKDCVAQESLPGGGLQGKHRIEGEPTIFVSMAAFRDRDAHFTLKSMFEKARFPRRVFVGVVCQKYPEDTDCLHGWECDLHAGFCPTDQVRMRTFHASKAKGPTHARSLAAAMYRGEDFFMMIDAHNRFVQDWDMKIINDVHKCPSKKCVLSCYPQGLNNSNPENPHPLGTPPGTPLEDFASVSFLCAGEFHERSIIKNQRASTVPMSVYPRPQPYTGAGLLFGPGRMIIEAPFDPHLPFLWDGEEFLYTARLWTWGYDMYSPSENILFHHYYRENQPRVWGEKSWAGGQGSQEQNTAYKRLQHILKATKTGTDELMVPNAENEPDVVKELPRFGLGPTRTIEEFWRYARIDIKNRGGDAAKPNHKGEFCRNFSSPKGPYVVPPY